MTTKTMLADYNGIAQDEANAMLDIQREAIVSWNEDIGTNKVRIGRTLNGIAANGLLIAAADDIDGKERDWSDASDGRKTAVSTFASEALPEVARGKISDWRKMARTFDGLEDDGIDTSGFAVSAFLALDESADDVATKFVDTVREVMAANDGKVTAVDFKAMGIANGIVSEAHAPKTAKPKAPKMSDLEATRAPVLAPLAGLLPAARDAVAAGTGFTKAQRQSMAAAAGLLLELAGDEA